MPVNAEEQLGDYHIIQLILNGDQSAFRHLVRRYQDQIYAMAVRQVRDPDTARELAQDVFIRAYNGLASFRSEAKFSTWLTRIALNVNNSYFSSRRYRIRARELPLEHFDLSAFAEASNEVTFSETAFAALEAAVAQLRPKYREVVMLCFLEQRSYAAAAEILEIPEGTVCSRMHAALKELRRRLKKA